MLESSPETFFYYKKEREREREWKLGRGGHVHEESGASPCLELTKYIPQAYANYVSSTDGTIFRTRSFTVGFRSTQK